MKMAETGHYIYGIINSTTPTKSLAGVYTVSYRDISIVVRNSEIIDYFHLSKDTLVMHLLKHQEVIEWIMAEHTIIPMRFGTFANNGEEVKEILTKGYRTIKNIFERIKEGIEIDVVATWSDIDSVLKEALEEEGIRGFKQALLSRGGGITVDDQIEIGVLVKGYLDKKRERYADEIQRSLMGIAQDLKAHDLMDDRMIINTAFLIGKDMVKDFDKRVGELNTRFAEKIDFRCVGPLPPYSFYTLEVKRMDLNEIDWARRRLGLNDTATGDEIRRAYKTKVFSSHPDKNPHRPGMEGEFDDVTRAYRTVIDYCQACRQAGHTDNYPFILVPASSKQREEGVKKDIILVKVKE